MLREVISTQPPPELRDRTLAFVAARGRPRGPAAEAVSALGTAAAGPGALGVTPAAEREPLGFDVDRGGRAQATAQVAAASTKSKPLVTSGLALRKASSGTNPEPASVSFTSYELRVLSEHRVLASDDDFVLRDGVINPSPSSTSVPRVP